MTTYRINAKVPWEVSLDAETGAWIGVCKSLRITALGETVADLHQSIFETMDALFMDLVAESELEHFLRDRGWSFRDRQVFTGVNEEVKFDIPIEVTSAANNCAHAEA